MVGKLRWLFNLAHEERALDRGVSSLSAMDRTNVQKQLKTKPKKCSNVVSSNMQYMAAPLRITN